MSDDSFRLKYGLTRAQAASRLHELSFDISDPVGNVFSSDVPTGHSRYIVDVVAHNNSANQLSYRLRRVLADNTTRAAYPTVPVSAYDIISLNKNADKLLNPVMVLTHAQNLDVLRLESTDLAGTVLFWDIPRN